MRTSSIFISAIGLAVTSSALPFDLLSTLHNRDVVVAPETPQTQSPPTTLKANQGPAPLGFHSKIPLRNGNRGEFQPPPSEALTTPNVEGSGKDVQPQLYEAKPFDASKPKQVASTNLKDAQPQPFEALPFDSSTPNRVSSINLNPETGAEIGKNLKVHLHRGDGMFIPTVILFNPTLTAPLHR